jgi:hypothetical protein
MPRTIARGALCAAALLAVSGCRRDTEFDVIRVFPVATTAKTFGPTVAAVDLAQEAGAAWDHRSDLKSVKVATVTAVASSLLPASGVTGSGAVALRPSGTGGSADLPLGSWTDLPLQEGAWLSTTGSPALDSAVETALRGDGQLALVIQGSASADFTANVQVTLHVDVEYSVSPF